MAKHDSISDKYKAFIERQQMFFVATAAPGGKVNLSPKGMDSLRVVDPNRVLWLNLTGSGNETAAHLLEIPRMTLMFCSFEKEPIILRWYGTARAIHDYDPDWVEYCEHFPPLPGARQVFEMDVDLVQNSCGFAVPRFEFIEQRQSLNKWAEHEGEAGLLAFKQEANTESLDGFETQIFDG